MFEKLTSLEKSTIETALFNIKNAGFEWDNYLKYYRVEYESILINLNKTEYQAFKRACKKLNI